MEVKIRINPLATADLQEIKNYIAEDNIDASIKTIKEIINKIESLSRFPEMGTLLMYKIKLKSKYRYVVSGQYLIFYIYDDNIISVQRVLHAKRDYVTLLKDQ